MAEIIGLVASLITIAGVGAKLANKLLKIGDRTLDANHQLNRVATNIALFSTTLKHFATVAQANADLLSGEGRDIATLLMEQCEGVFKDFAGMAVKATQCFPDAGTPVAAGKARPRRASIVNKIKAYFEVPKVNTLLAELEYLKSTMSLLIGTLTLAVTTAQARKEATRDVARAPSTETSEQLANERIHVETLIMARQLTMNILINKSTEETRAYPDGQLSPTASEDSFEDVKHPQQLLLQAAPQPSTSMIRLGDPAMSNLRRLFPGANCATAETAEDQANPITSTTHSQIIDQLLGRWTRLNEYEHATMENDRRSRDARVVQEEDVEEATAPRNTNPDPPELTLSKVQSPEDIPAAAGSEQQRNPNTMPDQGAALQVVPSPSLPPPPRNTANMRSFSVNSKLAPGPLLHRSMSTPGNDIAQLHIRAPSPQPNMANAVVIPNRDWRMTQYPPQGSYGSYQYGPSPSVSPRGSYVRPPVRRRNWRQPHVSETPSDSEEDYSPDDDNGLDYGIEWTIKVGNRYWDVLDNRVIGPRTPLLPTETLEDLYREKAARTEIPTKWVTEEAMKGSKIPYRMVSVKDEYITPGAAEAKRILVDRVLRFSDIESLVSRTVAIYQASKGNARQNGDRRSTPYQRTSQRREPPPNIDTHGHGQMQPQQYQSPAGTTPRDREQHTWPPQNRPAPRPGSRPPSYHNDLPSSRPTTADSGGSRQSGQWAPDSKVHFTESVRGGNTPPRRDTGRERYEENNFHYNPRRLPRHSERDLHHEHDSDSSEYDRRRDKRKRTSRIAKIGASVVGTLASIDLLDALI